MRWCDGSRSSCIAIISAYPNPPGEDLRVWRPGCSNSSSSIPATIPRCAPKSMTWRRSCATHIQGLMEARRASGQTVDDVLGRCLEMQKQGARLRRRPNPQFADGLHRRGAAAAADGGAAGDWSSCCVARTRSRARSRPRATMTTSCSPDTCSRRCASIRSRRSCRASPRGRCTIAAGTPRAVSVPEGTKIFVAFSSAMMDERRIAGPASVQSAAAAARIHPFRLRASPVFRHPHEYGAVAVDAEGAVEAEEPAAGARA